MSQYSELMGSFIRTGNYPLEADYIFSTVDELKNFYSDPINATTMHKGLFRIVENDGNQQALYWVTKKETNDELEFTRLITQDNIENFQSKLDDLLEALKKEIQDRKDGDASLWGISDPTTIPSNMNSVYDLYIALTELSERVDIQQEIVDSIKAIVGTDNDDIKGYLETLPYKSLTEVVQALDKFLNQIDSNDTKVNTLPELQNFLEGYSDTDTLANIIEELWNRVEGSPIPSEQFRTLRGIEDFVRTLKQTTTDRDNNLQSEIDQTQVGVGLNSDGAFTPDKSTYYLQDATSIMNALKTLDNLVHQAVVNSVLTPDNDNDVIHLDITKVDSGYVISGKLNLSSQNGNQLIKKSDGLYYNFSSDYIEGKLTFKINDQIVSSHDLGFSSIVEQAYFDAESENLVIIFKLLNGESQTVTIPFGSIIREWEVDNSQANKVVELHRQTVINGTDKLSGDVRISTSTDNILQKQGNSLYVKGTTDNIKHNGVGLDTTLVTMQESIANTETNLTEEIQRATTSEQMLTQKIDTETSDRKQQDIAIQGSLDNLKSVVESNKTLSDQTIAALQLKDSEIDEKTTNHIQNTNNPHSVTKAQIGLSNVDNTSDTNKPVSTAQQAAISAVKNTVDAYTVNGKKISTNPILNKDDVGLGQVDNTSDMDKPISTSVQVELDKKAPIESPTFTGIVQVETSPDLNDSSQRIPSTNWVNQKITSQTDAIKTELEEYVQQMLDNLFNTYWSTI